MPVSRKCTTALHWLRIGAYAGLGVAVLLLLLLLVHQLLCPVIAWVFPFSRPFFYDLAVFGVYPVTTFVSFGLPAPRGEFVRWNEQCDDGSIFIATDGKSVARQGPIILDGRGELVWMSADWDVAMNLRMQQYQGENYLTFWAGHKNGTLGHGKGYMLDSSYKVFREIQAVGEGLRADLHELQLTDQGTALITIYNVTNLDLRPMGWGRPQDGWVEDCLFQEIDIDTGELLFQWRAQDYFKPEDTYYWNPFGGYERAMPFDYYHINSIEKDSKGNYLISSRHFHHIAYINGTSGDPIWILGGREGSNQFTDLSNGVATGFQWQHHARWFSEEDHILTVFDNGNAGPLHVDAPYSKGLMIQLDLNQSTATVLQEYTSLGKAKAASMGSVAQLPNGHMLIGWGSSAAFSEHTIDGELLCEWHFAASLSFWYERAKNYRIYKTHSWVGRPDWPPSTQMKDDQLYVSWNGATEVRSWELQGLRAITNGILDDKRDFVRLEVMDKTGFEDSFSIPNEWQQTYTELRVAALDAQQQVLGYSDPIPPFSEQTARLSSVFVIVAASAVILFCAFFWQRTRSRRRRREGASVTADTTSGTTGTGTTGSAAFLWDWDPKMAIFGRGDHRYSKV